MYVFYNLLLQEEPAVTEAEKAQEHALHRTFQRVAGEDDEVDAYELRDILNAAFTKGLILNMHIFILQ